jgi:hypothetical protein
MCYYKEFDSEIYDFLLTSSVLSYKDVFVLLKSEYSVQLFYSLVSKLGRNFVVPIEVCAYTTLKKDTSTLLLEEDNDWLEDYIENDVQYTSVCVKSIINKTDFEYKKTLKYSEFQPIFESDLSDDHNDVPDFFKNLVTNYENNDNQFFIEVADGTVRMYARFQNNPEVTQTIDIGNMSGIEELKIDEFKEHFTIWMDNFNWESEFPSWVKELPELWSNLKSITFKGTSKKSCKWNPIQKFIDLGLNCEINLEFGAKKMDKWHAKDIHSEFYMWSSTERELKAIRFDELLFAHPFREQAIYVGNGFYCLNVKRSSYFFIKNLKIAFSFKHEMDGFPKFGIGFEGWWKEDDSQKIFWRKAQISNDIYLPHKEFKNHIFVRPSNSSCSCFWKYARSDEFDRTKMQKGNEESISEEQKTSGNNEKEKSEADEISTEGRKEAIKRIGVILLIGKSNFNGNKVLEKIDKKNLISLNLYSYEPNSFDKKLLDKAFSFKVISVRFRFMFWTNNKLINYLADKLEQNTDTLFEIVWRNEIKDSKIDMKGFFNINMKQRKRIVKIIRKGKWNEEVFQKPIFNNLTYIHSYKFI